MNDVTRTQPIQKKRKKPLRQPFFSLARLLLTALALLACLALAGGAAAAVVLPAMAAREFGPPAPGLSITQRVLYAYRLVSNQDSLLSPMQPGAEARSFTVGLGESVNAIAYRLEEERFIANADAFRTFLVYSGLDTGVQAGKYQLSPAITTVEIARVLQDPLPGAVDFNILPGWRVEEIAEALPMSGIEASPVEFMSLVSDPPEDLLPEGVTYLDSLEGYLMPGTYTVERSTTAQALVALFIQRFNETVTVDLRAGFANQGLSLEEAVTLASMVEREAVVDEEQPIIASVFLNRLANGMKLDSDPTVQYAVGYDAERNTWWKNPLTLEDLRVDSRYNTYIVPGLPPGPISNPGLGALRAVAEPASTPYFYFRALCDGSGKHAFAVTYEEHLQNACP